MSEHPYTNEQIETLCVAGQEVFNLTFSKGKRLAEALHEAGITLTFPEPRYYVEEWGGKEWGGKPSWRVVDDKNGGTVGYFSMEGRSELHAREFASWLNREAVNADGCERYAWPSETTCWNDGKRRYPGARFDDRAVCASCLAAAAISRPVSADG